MSMTGVHSANTDYDAAQALLDLQSNVHDTKHKKYVEKPLNDGKESAEAAKLFLSCFIASNVAKPSNKPISAPKIGTVSPMYAVTKNTTVKSETTSSMQTSKRNSPDQKSPRDFRVHSGSKGEHSNKRSKIFKRKPIKHFTVTAGPLPDIVTNKINSLPNNIVSNIAEFKVRTRDIGTQTEEKYQSPIIETMEFTISKLCEKIKSLEAQIKSNSRVRETINHDISENDNDFEEGDDYDDDESYKANSNDMALDDSNAFDSDMDETFSDSDITEKRKSKQKFGQYHEYNNSKVLSNRNVNANANDMVSIGDGNAMIPSRIYRHINWNSYTSATRKLLTAVFSRRILATHSLTGKPSPAFPNKPAKKKLDPALVNDIVQTVVERCCVPENVVRTSITTKCADESKMFRTREQNKKKKRKHKVNRENIPPDSDTDDL